jgi:hypothetical protein
VTRPLTGSERVKNHRAEEKLHEILDSCVWINLHCMLDAGTGAGVGDTTTSDTTASKSKSKGSTPITITIPAETTQLPSHSSSSLTTPVPASSVCVVLEVREASGYGARWSWKLRGCIGGRNEDGDGEGEEDGLKKDSAAIVFRGFVEPMVVGGHLNKWKH